ncbi:MAG: 1,2-phenylacetyl-CoA epoxidase subunit PaaE [Bacteroidota bacterium]
MAQFHTLTVQDIRQETADCVSVAFAVPDELKETFAFTQGQYITLRTQLKGEEVRRSYSLCVSPLDGEWRVAIKTVPGGLFSTYANEQLQIGDQLEAMPPEGRFYTQLDPQQTRRYVAFAAGSGITPIISIIKTVLETEPLSHFTLFYGNQRTESIIFRELIEGLKNTHLNRLSVHYLLSREHTGSDLFSGRIDAEKCRQFCQKLFQPTVIDAYFLCGPEAMTLAVRDELKVQGVAANKIHLELFGTSAKARRRPKKTQKTNTGFAAEIELQLDGNRIAFTMTNPDETILDAALRHGADLPFACKGGVCCTCRAKLEAGTADMAVNFALEPEEVEAGFTLSCQAYPTSDKIVVNFDV